jgi:hypothetical protein
MMAFGSMEQITKTYPPHIPMEQYLTLKKKNYQTDGNLTVKRNFTEQKMICIMKHHWVPVLLSLNYPEERQTFLKRQRV